jgi:hypothetical protein
MEKRGQVTIFIIISVLIVVAVILVFIFQNELGISTRYSANPSKFITDCIEKDLASEVENVISTGGVYYSGSNSDQFKDINGSKLAILCWTNKSRTSCTNTHPLLTEETILALEKVFTPKVNACFNKLKKDYPNIEITTGNLDFELDLQKDFVFVKMRNDVTMTKGEESEFFNNFDFSFNSRIYNFLELANLIVTAESSCICTSSGSGRTVNVAVSATNTNPFLTSGPNTQCDVDLVALAITYPNYLFERNVLASGEKKYTITSNEPPVQNFSFVVRNCVNTGCTGPGGICFHHYHVGDVIHYSSTLSRCHNNIHHYHDESWEYVID